MQFGSVPTAEALGAILAHGVRAGETRFRKGRALASKDIAQLIAAGVTTLTVARLESGDVAEDQAAARVAAGCGGNAVRTGAAFTGRVNLYATADGIAVVAGASINAINAIHESLTLATVAPFSRVVKGQMLATVKVIPFAAPANAVTAVEQVLREQGPIVEVKAFRPMTAALVSTYLPDTKQSLLEKNRSALMDRLRTLGSTIGLERRVPHETDALAAAVDEAASAGADPILVFGASAITDRRDIVPAAIEKAGGSVDHFGMPVDPGNLLLLGRLGTTVIVGLPSCARSPKQNGFDFVLWRLLAGVPVASAEISAMGIGGLLGEIPSRPQPRDERPQETPRLPRVAAIVLAAGLSSRMGSNKLLVPLSGKPLVRHVVEAATASAAERVIVVTGNSADEIRRAVATLNPLFAENRDYSNGLSTSLKCGLSHVPEGYDGAIIMLGDMPDVTADLLDKLIAAFDPSEGRAICVATHQGTRGNPVLWAHRFFDEIMALDGDVGARHLIAQNAELVCDVEAESDAPLIDIDTPQMLTEYNARVASANALADLKE